MNGEDYERVKVLETSAIEMEKSLRKKKKKNPDTGFAGIDVNPLSDIASKVFFLYNRLCPGSAQAV